MDGGRRQGRYEPLIQGWGMAAQSPSSEFNDGLTNHTSMTPPQPASSLSRPIFLLDSAQAEEDEEDLFTLV